MHIGLQSTFADVEIERKSGAGFGNILAGAGQMQAE
jgi:hypothetical protein